MTRPRTEATNPADAARSARSAGVGMYMPTIDSVRVLAAAVPPPPPKLPPFGVCSLGFAVVSRD